MRILLLVAAAMLAACGRPDVIENDPAAADALPRLNENEASPTGGPPIGTSAAAPVADAGSAAIPAQLQGRWGLSPGDCRSNRGDAKGLLIVADDSLRFYESRAVPGNDVQISADSASGHFNFTGEGRTWSHHLSLELREGKLVRTERDPLESFTYVRC